MVRVAPERSKLTTQPVSDFFFEDVTSDDDLSLKDSILTHFSRKILSLFLSNLRKIRV